MIKFTRAFLRNEDGATAIEYGLIGALVSVVIIVALTQVSSEMGAMFTTISNAISGASNG